MKSERRLHLRIGHKLMLMIALLTTGVIGFLATYWTSHQIDSMTADLFRKAETYGALLSKQASSAVAFSDRATAEEVLSSLEIDDDVAAIVLFGAEQQVLYTHGKPSPWLSKVGDSEGRVVHTVGRISAITPVRSLEGPGGMLISRSRSRSSGFSASSFSYEVIRALLLA